MEKIILPKSSKKLYYQVFRGITLWDCFIFALFIPFIILTAWLVPTTLAKILVCIFLIFIDLALIQKNYSEVRIYNLIFRFFKFLSLTSKKWISINLNLKDNKEVFSLKSGKVTEYLQGIKIETNNLELLNQDEQLEVISNFAQLLRITTLQAKIIKTNTNFNFNDQIKNLEQELNNKSEIQKEILNHQLEQFNCLNKSQELITPAIYLLFKSNSKQDVINQIKDIHKNVNGSLKISDIDYDVINKLIKEFNFNSNLVKPKRNAYKTLNSSGFIWAINNLPKQINYFWLRDLFAIEKINVCINLKAINKIDAKETLDVAINKVQTNRDFFARRESERQEANMYEEALKYQQDAIIDDSDVLKEISIFIKSNGNKDDLIQIKRELKTLSLIYGWKYEKLDFLQLQGLLAMHTWNNLIPKETVFEMTCATFATCFPIIDAPLKDDKGFLLAETTSGKPIVWDLFLETMHRRNKNLLILGESGSGKSFLAKKILANFSCFNSKIFIIDPEREYDKLTNSLNGEWVDMSGSNKNIINPLEIQRLEDDENSNDTFNNHFSSLEAFLTLIFPTLITKDKERSWLMKIIKETYKSKNINGKTNFKKTKANHFPIFSDVLKTIKKEIKKSEEERKIITLENIEAIIEGLSDGVYAKYWNGHTKFEWNSDVTCFDLKVIEASGNYKLLNAQMFLILRQLSKEMLNGNGKKLIIAVDEAHLLANEKNPIALDFLVSTAKRIRKYYGSLIVITQNCADFSGSIENKKKFTGIINNCNYSFIGGLQGDDLNDLNTMYKQSGGLSEAINNFISRAKGGKFFFKNSKVEQLPIEIIQTDFEKNLVEKEKIKQIEKVQKNEKK